MGKEGTGGTVVCRDFGEMSLSRLKGRVCTGKVSFLRRFSVFELIFSFQSPGSLLPKEGYSQTIFDSGDSRNRGFCRLLRGVWRRAGPATQAV